MKTFPPRRILVAFDFSRRATHAWRYANALARRVGARVQAIYVAPWQFVPNGPLALPPIGPEEKLKLQNRLQKRLGTRAAVHVSEGDVVGEILTAAKEGNIDLIVMATEGRTGLARIQGSFTETLVRLSPIPVLSLREAARLPKSVLAPVNLEPYSITGFHYAEAVAKALGARLTMLHVKERGFDDAFLVRLGLAADASRRLLHLSLRAEAVDGKPVPRILSEAAKHDLVVLVAHRRGIFRDGLLGTTAEQVLRRSKAPVLCVPAALPAPPPRSRARPSRLSHRRGAQSRRSFRGGPGTPIKM